MGKLSIPASFRVSMRALSPQIGRAGKQIPENRESNTPDFRELKDNCSRILNFYNNQVAYGNALSPASWRPPSAPPALQKVKQPGTTLDKGQQGTPKKLNLPAKLDFGGLMLLSERGTSVPQRLCLRDQKSRAPKDLGNNKSPIPAQNDKKHKKNHFFLYILCLLMQKYNKRTAHVFF